MIGGAKLYGGYIGKSNFKEKVTKKNEYNSHLLVMSEVCLMYLP